MEVTCESTLLEMRRCRIPREVIMPTKGVFDTLLNMNVVRYTAAVVMSWPDQVLRAGKDDQPIIDVDLLFPDGP